MPDPTTIEERIEADAIQGIATVTIAGQTTTVKSTDDLIKAADRVAGTAAMQSGGAGVYAQRMVRRYE